jgi:hypothetical protein
MTSSLIKSITLSILTSFILSGCGKTEIVYVDPTTGKVTQPPIESIKNESPKEACLNNVTYYNLGYHSRNFTPKIVLQDRVGEGKALTGLACNQSESPKEVCLNNVTFYDLGYHSKNYTPKFVLKDRVGKGKALTGVTCNLN